MSSHDFLTLDGKTYPLNKSYYFSIHPLEKNFRLTQKKWEEEAMRRKQSGGLQTRKVIAMFVYSNMKFNLVTIDTKFWHEKWWL